MLYSVLPFGATDIKSLSLTLKALIFNVKGSDIQRCGLTRYQDGNPIVEMPLWI